MKINTPFFVLEIEWLLLIVIFVTILSPSLGKFIYPFFICYLLITFHEFSHIFTASILGKKMSKLKLSLSGVCVSFSKNESSKRYYLKEYIVNLAVYLAGPISNIFLALLFKSNLLLFELNMSLAIINLIPIYPLDGYNIFNNILCIMKVGNKKSEIISEIVSNISFILLLLLAIFTLIFTLNPSILIFIIYLYLLKKERNKELRFRKIINNIDYI